MLDKLMKKIVGILADYKFNSTQTETAEMTAERIIGIVKQETLKQIEELKKQIAGLIGDNLALQSKLMDKQKLGELGR